MGSGISKSEDGISLICFMDGTFKQIHTKRFIRNAPWLYYWFPKCYAYHVTHLANHPAHPSQRSLDNDDWPTAEEAFAIARRRGLLPAVVLAPIFLCCKVLLAHADIDELSNLLNTIFDAISRDKVLHQDRLCKLAGDQDAYGPAFMRWRKAREERAKTRKHYFLTRSTLRLSLGFGCLLWLPLMIVFAVLCRRLDLGLVCLASLAFAYYDCRRHAWTAWTCLNIVADYATSAGGPAFVLAQLRLCCAERSIGESKLPPPADFAVVKDDNDDSISMSLDPELCYTTLDERAKKEAAAIPPPLFLKPKRGRAPPPGYIAEEEWETAPKKLGRTLWNKFFHKSGDKDVPLHKRSFPTPNPCVKVLRWVREERHDALEKQAQQNKDGEEDRRQDEEQSREQEQPDAFVVSSYHLAREDSGFDELSAGSEASSSPCVEALDRLVFGRSASSSLKSINSIFFPSS